MNSAPAPAVPKPPTEARSLLLGMLRGRSMEDAIGRVSGHYHPARGEEGVIVGSFSALHEGDFGVPHYRGAIVASLTHGADMRRLLAGVLGRETGYTRGRQRGDFVGRFERRFFGLFSGTLGPSIGYATGAGLSCKLDGGGHAALVTFGDGTSNSGLLYESLNMAAMLKLPVVYVCQNNQYAVSMPASRSIGGAALADRARAFGIEAVDVDGNDVQAVNATVGKALERARLEGLPSFVHALTYRVSGHWASDPGDYRPAAERDAWMLKDPIQRLAQALIAEGGITQAEYDALCASTEAEAVQAMELAQADPMPGTSVTADTHAYI
ncbi:MAG: thiamine pyrophosphate-dependent dehydrogenase E1 component subunit alpha [Comamonadaceae bacterium]|nr:thiamine pyrophosphate-dependent dehydrogenase E1 component subunit alpha [Comamonadaceae bacterium]